MKKILIIFISLLILTSCKSANDAFSLKKKNNTDEFLVEKKNPLVMPPDFGKLPSPKNFENDINLSQEDSIEDIIDNKYVLDLTVGITIFIMVIFSVLLVNKGISKAVSYTGIGGLDRVFGFFFGFIRAYIISICIFSGTHIVYSYDKWPINIDQSYIFPYLEKGSNYLIKEFPNEKTYQDSKEKIEEL